MKHATSISSGRTSAIALRQISTAATSEGSFWKKENEPPNTGDRNKNCCSPSQLHTTCAPMQSSRNASKSCNSRELLTGNKATPNSTKLRCGKCKPHNRNCFPLQK